MLTSRGIEHEQGYLSELERSGLNVARIPADGDLAPRVEATMVAMRAGVDVVYQAAFLDDEGTGPAWMGFADFLVKVDLPSDLGPFSYEPEDTKLARRVKPVAVLQLCAYAEQLEHVQGVAPRSIHVVLGTRERVTLRLADFAAYYRAAKQRFLRAVSAGIDAYPVPVEHCGVCIWRTRCDEQRIADDHLSVVPGLRSDHLRKLTDVAGIDTVAALALHAGTPATGIGQPTLEKLIRQALLLVEARGLPAGKPPYELLGPAEVGKGLGALPAPSPGDLFFDIESDPYIGTGGLEYLLGVGWLEADGTFAYRSFWSHSPDDEKASFEAFIDFVMDRLAQDPGMHVYHYAPYEPTALGRLMGRYGTKEDEVDSLFRGNVLVDLYHVVRQSICVGTPSYSLKKIESLYLEARTEAITDGGSSIAEYERWLDERDPEILTELERYNTVDCDSTRQLREFLEGLRPEYSATFGSDPPRPPLGVLDPPDAVVVAASENSALKDGLAAGAATEDETAAGATLSAGRASRLVPAGGQTPVVEVLRPGPALRRGRPLRRHRGHRRPRVRRDRPPGSKVLRPPVPVRPEPGAQAGRGTGRVRPNCRAGQDPRSCGHPEARVPGIDRLVGGRARAQAAASRPPPQIPAA